MKFVMSEMTYAKFYVPLIIEGNKRGIKSTVFISKNNKYNCPYVHRNEVINLSKNYDFDVVDTNGNIDACGDVVFTVEGTNRNRVINKGKIVSLYYSSDFTLSFNDYVNQVDHVILGSKFVADHYGKKSHNIITLGSPKFDVTFDCQDILRKYGLDNSVKIATIFYPRSRDVERAQICEVVKALKEKNYFVVLKTRGKDPFREDHKKLSTHMFMDVSWFPSTAMELISISDVIFNFSSTVIEETIALRKPMINWHVKPFTRPLDFLYDFDFVRNIMGPKEISEAIDHLEAVAPKDYDTGFKLLFDEKNSSKSILDRIL